MLKRIKFAFILFFLFVQLNAITCDSSDNFKNYGNHYYAVTAGKISFKDAKISAQNSGGYLAIPNDETENDFITTLVKGSQYAWIGVYDPNYISNYCYEGKPCVHSKARFRTVKSYSLIYENFNDGQPDNLVKKYDVIDEKIHVKNKEGEIVEKTHKKQMVAPLGEHWVAIASPSGKWADFGNHADSYNNPIKQYAVFEFDTSPDCKTTSSTSQTDTDGVICNTSKYGEAEFEQGQTFNCQQDKYKQYYCPSELSLCKEQTDHKDGTSIKKLGHKYTKQIDSIYHDLHFDLRSKENYKEGSITWHNYDYPINRYEYVCTDTKDYSKCGYSQRIGGKSCFRVQRTRVGMYDTISYGKKVINCKDYFGGINYRVWGCPNGYNATRKKSHIYYHDRWECKITSSYTYYDYICPAGYTPKESGGDCDVNRLIDTNGDGVEDSCNWPNPPKDNCFKKTFICNSNKEIPCAYVDNNWQCSQFACYGHADDKTDTPAGSHDAHDDGWNDDGSCSGKIYIFNGKDSRCKIFDTSWIQTLQDLDPAYAVSPYGIWQKYSHSRNADIIFGSLPTSQKEKMFNGGCCAKQKGFTQDYMGCTSGEKELVELKAEGKCYRIGDGYCAKHWSTGIGKAKITRKEICLKYKYSYCCFSSKLARIINEQGRPQIDKDWGSSKSPECKGFTPQEFEKLDFSKIDLSEYLDEIKEKFNTSVSKETQESIKDIISDKIKDISKKQEQ